MGLILRQSLQNTVISYLGIALGFVSTILLFPNFLESDQFGLTRVLLSIGLICAQFAHLGMNNVVIRFFPYYQHTKESRSQLLSLAIGVPILGYAIFLLLLYLFRDPTVAYFSDQSDLFSDYYLFLTPLVFGVLFFEVLNSYIRSLKDSVTGSFVNEILVRILVIILLIAYFYEWISFNLFMILFVSVYAIQPVCLLVYLFFKNQLFFSLPIKKNTKRLYKGMSIYGAYSVLGGLATLLVGNIDIIMIGSMVDLSSTAVYAIAFYIGSVIAIPQRSITKIASPILADYIKSKNFPAVDDLYVRTAQNQLIAGSLIYVGIWSNMHNVIDLLPAEYSGIYWVVVIVGLAKLFNMATGVNGLIIIYSKHYRFDLYTNILLVVLTIITNLLLIPVFGITGAATATALSIFIYNIVKFLFVWRKFSMQPFQLNAVWVIIIAGVCLLISEQIPYMMNFFVDVAVRSLIILILFTSAVLLFRLSDDFQNLAAESLKRIKLLLTRQ